MSVCARGRAPPGAAQHCCFVVVWRRTCLMPWLKMSDTAAMHPIVLAVAEHPDADERSVDEVFGYVSRLATMSAQYLTDYVFWFSTAMQVAGSRARAERLLDMAQFAGYGSLGVDAETGRRFFRLVNDPEFIHMKTAEEVAFERDRKANNSDVAVTVPVRMRDGDACRYCGLTVNWRDRKGGKGGTYDHRLPGRSGTWQTQVVACRSCNSRRGGASKGLTGEEGMRAADAVVPLLAPPSAPYWSPGTRVWLNAHADVLALHQMRPPELAPEGTKALRAGTPARQDLSPSVVATPVGAAGAEVAVQEEDSGATDPGVTMSVPEEMPGSTDPGASVGEPFTATPTPATPPAVAAQVHESSPGSDDPGTAAAGPLVPRLGARPATEISGGPAGVSTGIPSTADPGGNAGGPGDDDGPGGTGTRPRARPDPPRPRRPAKIPDLADPARSSQIPARYFQIPAGRKGTGSGYAGSGRDGSGRDGTGGVRDGPGSGRDGAGAEPPGVGGSLRRARKRKFQDRRR